MQFRPFYLFYLLTILLAVWGFMTIGLWTFFVPTSIASLVTGIVYHLFYKTNRQISQTLIIIHFGLVLVGIPLTLNMYSAFMTIANAGAPDTAAISSGLINFLGPIFLLGSLVIFIVALSTSKRTTV